MKIIRSLVQDKYFQMPQYSFVEGDIYQDASGGVGGRMGIIHTPVFCITLCCELEDGEDTQYPLEDMLDEYCVNCTQYFHVETIGGKRFYQFEVESENLDQIRNIAALIGKRVFNVEREDGYFILKTE